MVQSSETVRLGGRWGVLEVHPLGATVTSWRPHGREVLFTATDARPGVSALWHGGIPVCAPWFGAGPGTWQVPFIHGLVSRVAWEIVSTACDDAAARVVLATDAGSLAHLPGADRFADDLSFSLDVVADERFLTLGLTVTSPARDATVEMAFHPYLRVDAPTAVLSGLEGVAFTDYADGSAGSDVEAVTVGRSIDRVYAAGSPTDLVSRDGALRLSATGAESVIVWNPGPGPSQVPEDDWLRFVCVEYGCVKEAATFIPAGGSHTLRLTIEAQEGPADPEMA